MIGSAISMARNMARNMARILGTKTSVISWIWVSWIWVTVWLTRGKRFGRSRCPSIRRLVKKSLGRLRFPEKIHPKGGFCAEKAHSVLMIRHS